MRKPGLRLQLLLLLGGLLVLTFIPLQLALATYTRVTLRQLDDSRARANADALSAYLTEVRPSRAAAELMTTLRRDFGASGLVAAHLEPPAGQAPLSFGEDEARALLSRVRDGAAARTRWLPLSGRRIWTFGHSDDSGSLRLAMDADRASARGFTLIRIFGLYAFLIASSLLVLAYFALTRLIVRPLDQLAQSVQSVTLGSRQLQVPATPVRELSELGEGLKRMTDRLLNDERSLRKQVAEVERATLELRETQNQLVRSERMASVGRLAAGLAHEIGNPIAAVMGLQDLLLEPSLSAAERRDFLRRMRDETERINRTLRDLLDFARKPAASAPGDASGDVEAAVHDTATLVSHQASMKNLELKIDVHPELPRVSLSTERLMQVLLNLVLNAVDALENAKTDGWVAVSAQSRSGGVCIDVIDNGAGISDEAVDHVFEPFFTTKEVGRGTGLGLSVCQGLVEAAQGRLELDRSAASTRFRVWLPSANLPTDHELRDSRQ